MSSMTTARSGLLTIFVAAVDFAALASLGLLYTPELLRDPLSLTLLLALAGTVGARSVRLTESGLRVVAADAFIFCALLAFAPAAAPLVALASMLGVAAGKDGKLLSVKAAFNTGAVPLSMAAGTAVFLQLGGSTGGTPGAVLPLFAAAATFGIVNVLLTTTAVHLGTGRNWLELLRQSFGVAIVSGITHALLGAGLMWVFAATGPLGLALGLVPVIPMEQYARGLAGRFDRLGGRIGA